jgi:phosphoglycolate phosphatase
MNLIFDFDGTLCDSLDESIIIANQFLTLIRKPTLTASQVREKGMKAVLLSYKVPNSLLPLFMLYYRWQASKRIVNMKIFDEIAETIKELSQNHTLGIVTSNSVTNVESFLQKYALKDYFSFIDSELSWVSKDKKVAKIVKKHNLSRTDTYYIGDETRDIISMKRINIKMIAVTWGIEDEKLLKDAKPYALIHKPSELLSAKRFSKN